MASTPEETIQPVMELPLDPIPVSLEHGTPISISIPPPPMVPLTTAAILSHRRRRKSSASASLKRSASTPNVREHRNSDADMTLAEKRRNKLGYHRTSVACGHCRRRKIRCLAAPDDHQGRCANCIRLKKECTFFPVEQQPPVERRPRAGSRMDGRGSTSSDSSPALNGGHIFNQLEPFSNFNTMPFSNNPDYPPASASLSAGVVSPMTRVSENSRGFDFPQQSKAWGSPFADSGQLSAGYSSPGDAASQSLWGRHDSPVTPGFSPHGSGQASSLTSFSDSRGSLTSFAPSRNDSWSVPPRSMSFGIVEGLPVNNNFESGNYYPHSMHREIRRRASDLMRPPSLQTSSTSSNTSLSEQHLTPLSAPIPSPPSAQWNLPTAPWSALPGTMMSKPYEADWYSTTTPLAKVQEEETSTHFGSEPTILYAGVEGQ